MFIHKCNLPRRDRSAAPFKCLDAQYRRELVRVYLTNVEGICRRFVEEKREQLLQLKKSMGAFQIFWDSQTSQQRAEHATMKGDEVHKVGTQTARVRSQYLRFLSVQLPSTVGALSSLHYWCTSCAGRHYLWQAGCSGALLQGKS